MNKYIKKFFIFLSVSITLLTLFIPVLLHFSYVVLSKEGIYQNLVLLKKVKINTYLAGSSDTLNLPNKYIDGPIVLYHQDSSKTVKWFQQGEVFEKKLDHSTNNYQLLNDGEILNFELPPIKKPQTVFKKKPRKIAFISDHHGDYDYYRSVLEKLEVIDKEGNWSYGENHLVIAGDMVDRGIGVHKILWDIVKLSKQAEDSAGMVHYLIGNHEQYILKGLFSRVNPLNLYSLQQIMPFKEVFSKRTYLGKWLRSKPLIINIDGIVITHGGISPQTHSKKLSIEGLNEIMWNYWSGTNTSDSLKEVILGRTGITQYRGYFMAKEEVKKVSKEEISNICDFYKANTIVVGHTDVPFITPLYDDKVYNINAITSSSEILLFHDGEMTTFDTGIIKYDYDLKTKVRPFDIMHANDWKMIFSTFKNMRDLSKIKHPY